MNRNSRPRIYLSPPHLGKAELQYVADAFATNWIAPLGPHVDAFEKELAAYVKTPAALALSSGTAAVHLALKLCGVGAGDCVFSQSLTFCGSTFPILYQGATPVFIDSELSTWNMSPEALGRAFEKTVAAGRLPKAVIVVALFGQSADMDPLLKICDSYGVPVIEDAAESLGATYKGSFSGTMGRYGIYSFNGNKIITTSGGGALVSHDLKGLEKARFWATQSRDPARHYQHSEIGYNYRLSNVLAGIGRGQLLLLEDRIASRRRNYGRYLEALGCEPGFSFMPEAGFGRSTHWLTVLTVDPAKSGVTRDELIDALEAENIEARPVWKPMHLQPIFAGCEYFPHEPGKSASDCMFEQGVCLPSGSSLTIEDQDRVIRIIMECLKQSK